MSKLTTQELDIYKNYILNEIAERVKKHGHVEPEHLNTILDINIEFSDVTELIYPTIIFNAESYNSYKLLDKFNLIDKPNNLFDNYKLSTLSVPVRRLITHQATYYVTPYSPKDKLQLVNEKKSETNYTLWAERNHKITILTNGDKESIDFLGEEYQLIIDYIAQNETELNQYRTKIEELLLEIFKKLKPISADKLVVLVKKHYNSEE